MNMFFLVKAMLKRIVAIGWHVDQNVIAEPIPIKSYCDKSKSDILVSIAIKSAERVAAMLSAIFNVFPL